MTAVLFSPAASACETCFGDPNSSETKGMAAAIITLLIITYVMLTGIIGFFVYVRFKARSVAQATVQT
jgi:hypothetical protein